VDLIVDTSVWSLFLRRKELNEEDLYVKKLRYYIDNQDCIHLIGNILQEILYGVKLEKQFNLLIEYFKPYPLIDFERNDFINAAKIKNVCRKKGVQASSIDFLITAVCINRNYPLLSSDKDFIHIANHCNLILL
jgi:predicted nucleic acid-binding protein